MWNAISALIAVLRALFDLYNVFKRYQAQQAVIIKDNERHAELEKAVDESKKAETDDKIFKSQQDIVRNRAQ